MLFIREKVVSFFAALLYLPFGRCTSESSTTSYITIAALIDSALVDSFQSNYIDLRKASYKLLTFFSIPG